MGGITKNASIIVLDSPDSDRQIGAPSQDAEQLHFSLGGLIQEIQMQSEAKKCVETVMMLLLGGTSPLLSLQVLVSGVARN